jgi:hypothetical protein
LSRQPLPEDAIPPAAEVREMMERSKAELSLLKSVLPLAERHERERERMARKADLQGGCGDVR